MNTNIKLDPKLDPAAVVTEFKFATEAEAHTARIDFKNDDVAVSLVAFDSKSKTFTFDTFVN